MTEKTIISSIEERVNEEEEESVSFNDDKTLKQSIESTIDTLNKPKKLNKKKEKKKQEKIKFEEQVKKYEQQIKKNAPKNQPTSMEEYITLQNKEKCRQKRLELQMKRTGQYNQQILGALDPKQVSKYKKLVKNKGPTGLVEYMTGKIPNGQQSQASNPSIPPQENNPTENNTLDHSQENNSNIENQN